MQTHSLSAVTEHHMEGFKTAELSCLWPYTRGESQTQGLKQRLLHTNSSCSQGPLEMEGTNGLL